MKGIHQVASFITIFILFCIVNGCKEESKGENMWNVDEFCAFVEEIEDAFRQKAWECAGVNPINPYRQRTCELRYVKELIYTVKVSKTVLYRGDKMREIYDEIMKNIKTDCTNFMKRSNLVLISKRIRFILSEVFEGKRKEGETCFFDFECSEGLFCGGKSCPGVCMRKAEEGESCERPVECLDKLTCIDGVCTKSGGEGQRCIEITDCDGSMICLDGRCARIKGKGKECKVDEECEFLCDKEEKRCVGFRFSDIGRECGIINGEFVLCKMGKAYCKMNTETLRGVCEELMKEGQKCSRLEPSIYRPNFYGLPRCAEGLFCSRDEVCKKLPAEGEPCELYCASDELVCIDGKCQKVKENGDTCLSSQECRSGICENGKCKEKGKSKGNSCEFDEECSNLNCRGGICCSPM